MPNALMNVSPIDGRYKSKTMDLATYFSEFALIKYRVKVELEYFIFLWEEKIPELRTIDSSKIKALRQIDANFSETDAERIKAIESVTNHDVKAVEYFIKEKFEALGLSDFKEFVHFGLTSQDINNTSVPWSIKDFVNEHYLPELKKVLAQINQRAKQWATISMLARTHGQPASPTTLGKEWKVFAVRLEAQISQFEEIKHATKFGGATGNMNAHFAAYPNIDWHQKAQKFVEKKLGMCRSYPTTQIEHYDHLAGLFHLLERINTICLDFCKDLWQYIAMDYFKQKIKKGEVGSSAMPHKVNPIDFENAEGNLGVANAILTHLASKLPVSRLQRDLTDSTVLRNIGVPFGHITIAFKSMLKGLDKLIVNQAKIEQDLNQNTMVLAEAIQTVLRKINYPEPYEALKVLTRKNEKITLQDIHTFIDELGIDEELKKYLKTITPSNYIGKL